MESLFQFIAPPSACGYLPGECWQLEYEIVRTLSREEYFERLVKGWRRFGVSLFRPRCPSCSACRSLRVLVDDFRADRRLRRVRKANQGDVRIAIGTPAISRAKLALYDRYHAFQADLKGWPEHETHDTISYSHSFIDNPLPTQEWCYYIEDRLVGVGYVDDLPGALSAIYFYYDPDFRDRSLGTWNVLCLIEHAARRGLRHLYLGYYVEACRSMVYKASFVPNQLLGADGSWHDFRK